MTPQPPPASPTVIYSLTKLVGRSSCVSLEAAELVHARLRTALTAGMNTTLSCRGASLITPTFWQVAIGPLCGEFPAEDLRARLHIHDLAPEDLAVLQWVVCHAQAYFQRHGWPPSWPT